MAGSFSNKEVAQILREVAAAYEVKGNSYFQARAYHAAAEVIEQAGTLIKDLWEQGKLQELPGIGGNISQHLDELFRTGKVKHFTQVKKGLPPGMFPLLQIPGLGPKSAYKLAKALNVKSVNDLKKACQQNRVARLEGFGKTSQEKILHSLKSFLTKTPARMLLPVADYTAQKIISFLAPLPSIIRVDPLGSLRRMASTIGDIDLAVASSNPAQIIDKFLKFPDTQEIINQGKVEASLRLSNGTRVDLRVQDAAGYGALLQHYTGSKRHNIHLRELARTKNLSLSEYGIRKGGKRGRLIKFATEEEFYSYLGLDWIPPELREDTGEIEAAQEKKLPQLVKTSDIKGDLHVHCNFDLEESHDAGQSSIEEIAQKGIELGYHYIAIGNHSPSVSRHNQDQIRHLILAKQKEINRVQKKFPQIKLLNMIEVDVLANKTLALDDNNLKLLDIAIAGVHSSLNQPKEQMTERVLAALNNPYIHGLAHPTGRLLNQRKGYELNWDKVFTACIKGDKFLEINSFYNRLDLPDMLIKQAIKAGVKLAINTDAHEINSLNLIKYGVATARRGWAEKKNIINTKNTFP